MEKSKKIKEKINKMQNSISYWQHLLLQEMEEGKKELSPKQKKIAKLDPPADEIDAGDFAKLRAGAKVEEGQQEDWSQIYDQGYAEGYELGWKDGSSGKENSNPKAASKFKYGQDQFSEGEDHEVSMANNSLETIIKHAMDLKSKLGSEEKDIPAWIQDHITNAANFISQAAENYHEYSSADGGEEKTDDEIETASLEDLMEKIIKTKK